MIDRKRKKKQKMIAIGIAGGVLLLAVIYLGLAFFFQNHFVFRTEINGWKVGGMSVEKAEEKIGDHAEDYLLTIYDRDGEKHHLYGKDLECEYVPDGSTRKILKQQKPFAWIASIFKTSEKEVALTMEFNEDLITGAVSDLDCFKEENMIEPQNAQILLGDDGYYVEPEIMGTHMIYENVLAKVKTAVSKGDNSVELTDEEYMNPEIKADSEVVTGAMATIEKYRNTAITYQLQSGEQTTDAKQMEKFIQLGENYTIGFNEKEITKYVQSMASANNTFGRVRSFKTSSGDIVEIGGGDYGWIVNKPKEEAQIKADMEAGQPVTREPVYSQRAYVEGKEDIGNTYIEIDYTKQHMWYYENGALVVDTDIVSGNINRNNGSPDGVFKIVYKESPAVLKGEDYESNVTYFMPFAYNVGIHDATWRGPGEFGGERYKTNGSHGCINANFDVAKTIFDKVKVGTPVIAYYREPVTLTAENCRISNAYSYVKPETETPAGE